MKKMCIIFQKKLLEHDFGPDHPSKTRARLTAFLEMLRSVGFLDLPEVTLLEPDEEVRDDDILAVHDISLLNTIKELSREGGTLDADTPLPKGTYERTKLQAGILLYGARAVLEGKFDRMGYMSALGGHHATRRHEGLTFGFCFLNMQGIVTRRLQREKRIEKVIILDTDCHHGNGTQDIFYDDPTVLTVSLHQDPRTIYPGISGYVEEIGEGKGKGFNVNVPLPPLTGCQSYLKALTEIFPPIAREFKPDLILATLGGDTHFKEPLTTFGLGLDCFQKIADIVVDVTNEVCGGKIIGGVSGGRDLTVGARIACESTASLLEYGLLELEDPFGKPPPEPAGVAREIDKTLVEVKHTLAPYWHCFKRS